MAAVTAAQVACEAAAGLTEPRKGVELKRFLPRRVDGSDNGFIMLKCRECRPPCSSKPEGGKQGLLSVTSCRPPFSTPSVTGQDWEGRP